MGVEQKCKNYADRWVYGGGEFSRKGTMEEGASAEGILRLLCQLFQLFYAPAQAPKVDSQSHPDNQHDERHGVKLVVRKKPFLHI